MEHGNRSTNQELHHGIALFTEILLNSNPSKLNSDKALVNLDNPCITGKGDDASIFTSAVTVRSRYIGEVC